MNRAHRRFLELAAASIDFELSGVEREELAAHLATCDTCPRALDGMRADARSIRALPTREIALARSPIILRRALRRGPDLSSLRLVALAAVLALLLVGLVVVGSSLLRRPETPVVLGPSASLPRTPPSAADIPSSLPPAVWRGAAPLQAGRSRHAAGVLEDGRVVVAGGWDAAGVYLGTSESFDPERGAWSMLPMQTERVSHAGTVMPDGEIFLVGGNDLSETSLASTEQFSVLNAELGWQPGPSLAQGRASPAVAILPDRTLLVIGGFNSLGQVLDTAEVYRIDLVPGFVSGAPLSVARGLHTATVLADGRVLVVGGVGRDGGPIASCEIFDPAGEQWHEVEAMSGARVDHTATLLPDGRVLVTGGAQSDGAVRSAEIFDPATETWSAAASMAEARLAHEAIVLDGRVLVVGGEGALPLSTTEWYDPASDQWSPGSDLLKARSFFALVLLRNGSVMAIGGQSASAGGMSDAEVLGPFPRAD